ncbi:MAG: DUF1501 domain-containing protein [Planctomycetota bacterium]
MDMNVSFTPDPEASASRASRLSRREWLSAGALVGGSLVLGQVMRACRAPSEAPVAEHRGARGDSLVCIFLRGGADGLHLVPPHAEDAYHAARPTIAVGRPDDRRAAMRALDLDGFFGLHPMLEPLLPIYRAGHLAIVHATGSLDKSRSHFNAMDTMERGAMVALDTGWLGRHLMAHDTGNPSALRAVSIGYLPQAALAGASATALIDPARHRLEGDRARWQRLLPFLRDAYASENAGATCDAMLAGLDDLARLDSSRYVPRGPGYPAGPFARCLSTLARFLRAGIPMEVACLDLAPFDSHGKQALENGELNTLLTNLALSLRTFYEDLAEEMDRVTVVVMTEFGRRLHENGAEGTDHGYGSCLWLMGGGVAGGRVHGRWPGLAPENLFPPGDLDITTDYRDVLAEVLRRRLLNPRTDLVFPGHPVHEIGVIAADRV